MSAKNGKPSSSGRDGKGRFKPGNSAGGGNPYANRIYNIKRAILDATDPADVVDCLKEMESLWRDSDNTGELRLKAMVAWMERVCGKPDMKIEMKTDEHVRDRILEVLETRN